MTKKELIESISKQTGIDKKSISVVIESLMKAIKEKVVSGENVTIRGFGTFGRKKRSLKHFHAAPGKWIEIPEHNIPCVVFSKDFMEKVKYAGNSTNN